MDRRIAFQMGCTEIVDPAEASGYPVPHFTTLVDINTYIVGFYEFMMRKYFYYIDRQIRKHACR